MTRIQKIHPEATNLEAVMGAPKFREILSTWLSLTDTLLSSGADTIKDRILDLGCPPDEQETPSRAALPPLDPADLVAALLPRAREALCKSAELLNQESTGPLSIRTRDQVISLFEDLAEEVLEQGLNLRFAAACPECKSDWVRKYRRMLAEEGQWPVVGE